MAKQNQITRYRDHLAPILVVWTVVTGIIVTMVLNEVLPGFIPEFYAVYHYFIGPTLLVAVGVYVAHRSTRPWVVALGALFLLWAAMSISLGCPGRACTKPDGFQYWRNIKFALDAGIGGPRLLISTETGACAFQCPYKIQVIPLAIGYGSYALGVFSWKSK
jgi:hypothetical protein